MSVRSKVAAAAVPEAAAARHLSPGTSAKDTNAELQRRRREAADRAAARRTGGEGAGKPASPASPASSDTDDDRTPAPAPSSSSAGGLDAVHTGGGFLLGFLGWVVFVNYMQGGIPQVRKLAAAKFLNKTGG